MAILLSVLLCRCAPRQAMSVPPEALTETPDRHSERLLEDVLGVIHLSGSLILRAELGAPWGYESPPAEQLKQVLRSATNRLILFHIIPEGRAWVEINPDERVELEGGDV